MAIRPIRILSLCSGVGGLDLGVHLAAHARTVCYVEREAHAAAALVAGMEATTLDCAPVWDDLTTFDGAAWRGSVDCIVGGYPCQPFSHAGRREGERDERHLWPRIAEIVAEVQPRLCFFENVAGHLSLGLETVVSDLERMGYRVACGLFAASEVGAPHKRERLFILADADQRGRNRAGLHLPEREQGQTVPEAAGTGDAGVADAAHDHGRSGVSATEAGVGQDGERRRRFAILGAFPPGPADDWSGIDREAWPALPQSDIRGVADGLASRVDRLRACGNAVVPLVAAHAFTTLALALERPDPKQGGLF